MRSEIFKTLVIPFLLIAGFVLRLFAASWGDPYDIQSFWLVAEKFSEGLSPYEFTMRYNYGPVWFNILGMLRSILTALSLGSVHDLHMAIAGLLSLSDLGIYFLLAREFGRYRPLLFYLNPVVILLTGYHSHFDSIAILCGLYGWRVIVQSANNRSSFVGAIFLGLSLATKHILFLFPIWIFFLRRTLTKEKLTSIWCPYLIFGLSFVPWLLDNTSRVGVFRSVFGYQGVKSESLLSLFREKIGETLVDMPMIVLFIPLLLLVGWYWAKKVSMLSCDQQQRELSASLPIYLIALVAAASAMANQYLYLPILAWVYFPRSRALLLYSLTSLWLLSISEENVGFFLQVTPLKTAVTPYYLAQILLCLSLVEITRSCFSKLSKQNF